MREAIATVRRRGPGRLHRARARRRAAQLLALSDLGIDAAEGRRRAEAAIADGSAWRRTSGGSRRRAATQRSTRSRPPPSSTGRSRARGLRRRALSAMRGRRRRTASSAPAAARRRTRSTTRSGSSASVSAGTGSRPASRSRRSTRETMLPPNEAALRCSRPTRSRDEPPPSAAGRTRSARVARRAAARARPSHPWTLAGYAGAVPELPEVETIRRRLGRAARGPRFERVEIFDPRLDASRRPGRGRGRARGRARGGGRSSRQVFGCSVREWSDAPDSPPDDGERCCTSATGRPLARTRTGVLLSHLDNGSDVAYRDVRRFGTWLLLEPGRARRRTSRLATRRRAARPRHFTTARLGERTRGPARAGEGGAARPAHGRRHREHLRRRGALAGAHPSAADRPGRSSRGEIRALHRGNPRGARGGHRAPGRDACATTGPRRRRGPNAARVQRLRTRGGAVPAVRRADRKDSRGWPRNVVLPARASA